MRKFVVVLVVVLVALEAFGQDIPYYRPEYRPEKVNAVLAKHPELRLQSLPSETIVKMVTKDKEGIRQVKLPAGDMVITRADGAIVAHGLCGNEIVEGVLPQQVVPVAPAPVVTPAPSRPSDVESLGKLFLELQKGNQELTTKMLDLLGRRESEAPQKEIQRLRGELLAARSQVVTAPRESWWKDKFLPSFLGGFAGGFAGGVVGSRIGNNDFNWDKASQFVSQLPKPTYNSNFNVSPTLYAGLTNSSNPTLNATATGGAGGTATSGGSTSSAFTGGSTATATGGTATANSSSRSLAAAAAISSARSSSTSSASSRSNSIPFRLWPGCYSTPFGIICPRR